MPCVYILKSQRNSAYYIGSTNNLDRRLREHLSGKVLSTKHLLPLELAFHQEFKRLSAAREAENKIKKWKRRDFIEKVVKNQKLEFRKKGPDTR